MISLTGFSINRNIVLKKNVQTNNYVPPFTLINHLTTSSDLSINSNGQSGSRVDPSVSEPPRIQKMVIYFSFPLKQSIVVLKK